MHLEVDLGPLQPADVVVELVLTRGEGAAATTTVVPLQHRGAKTGTVHAFDGGHRIELAGAYQHGMRVRVPGSGRHDAKVRGDAELVVWGTGTVRREFAYSRDLARACLFISEHYDGPDPINLGGGTDVRIADAARAVAEVVGFRGRLRFDASKPDGAPLKSLDSAPLLRMGWRPEADFRAALAETYDWFRRHRATEGAGHAPRTV